MNETLSTNKEADAVTVTEAEADTTAKQITAETAGLTADGETPVCGAEQADADGKQDPEQKSKKGEKKASKHKQPLPHEILIRFSQIRISKWNAGFDAEPNEADHQDLAKDIEKHGLMHAVTLANNKNGEGGVLYTILAGTRRIGALKFLRGADSGLRASEFKVHEKLNESDEKCLDYSLSENTHRYGHSVLDDAMFYGRMVKKENVKVARLAQRQNVRREAVSRLVKLYACRTDLPGIWLKDLGYKQKPGAKKASKAEQPRITLTHWIEIAGKVGDDGVISDSVRKLMEQSYEKRYSASKLRTALAGEEKPASTGDAGVSDKADHTLSKKELRQVKTHLSSIVKSMKGKTLPADEGALLSLITAFQTATPVAAKEADSVAPEAQAAEEVNAADDVEPPHVDTQKVA